jgi:hypothetical protein
MCFIDCLELDYIFVSIIDAGADSLDMSGQDSHPEEVHVQFEEATSVQTPINEIKTVEVPTTATSKLIFFKKESAEESHRASACKNIKQNPVWE